MFCHNRLANGFEHLVAVERSHFGAFNFVYDNDTLFAVHVDAKGRAGTGTQTVGIASTVCSMSCG